MDELDELLDVPGEGRWESEGHSTVAPKDGLRKLCSFQLPTPHDWALKVVQALVASGAQELESFQGRKATVFRWRQALRWTIDKFEQAFYSPDPSPEPGIRHLVTGLRSVGLQEKRNFELQLAVSFRKLSWDGEILQRLNESPGPFGSLEVAHLGPPRPSSWIAGKRRASNENLEVLRTLSDRAYVCPIPLTIDGRRLLGLAHCPTHGLSPCNWPVALLALHGPALPAVWPPLSWRSAQIPAAEDERQRLLGKIAAQLLKSSQPLTGAAVMLVTAHLSATSSLSRLFGASDTEFEPSASILYWVQDGAIIEQEKLPLEPSGVSIAIFVNASALETDPSSLRLVENSAKSQSREAVHQKLAAQLDQSSFFPESAAESDSAKLYDELRSQLGQLRPRKPE